MKLRKENEMNYYLKGKYIYKENEYRIIVSLS